MGPKNNAGGGWYLLQLQQCAKKRPNWRSTRVPGSPGRRAGAELLLFLGRGPLQRGVLQQLMHTEFTFPGEQKDWYPAEAMRQAADDAHDLRYMIPATDPEEPDLAACTGQKTATLSPHPHGEHFSSFSYSPETWYGQGTAPGCFVEPPPPPKIQDRCSEGGGHHFPCF